MAHTSSPALDAMSLQRWVEGKGLQPSGGSSRAACGQDTFTQLHALVWQHSWGEGHLDALGEKPGPRSPSPCVAVTCYRLSTAETGAQQAWAALQPAWDPELHSSGSPQLPQTSPSHSPASQPAPFPKLRQSLFHVTFQSPQVTVLSSKVSEYHSSFGGCPSHDVLMCMSCNM